MCGRYGIDSRQERLARFLGIPIPEVENYDARPTQRLPVYRLSHDGTPEIALLKWGLVPFFAKDPTAFAKLSTINARAETADTKPTFREAFKRRRCLIPMNGFYEWQEQADKSTVRWWIKLRDQELFAVAGLWDRWRSKDSADDEEDELQSFTVLVGPPNPLLAAIHNRNPRMPMILDPDAQGMWMDPATPPADAKALLEPYPESLMEAWPVRKQAPGRQQIEPSEVPILDA